MKKKKITQSKEIKGERVLVFGFGLHGGGRATTQWLLGQGAQVRVTDQKTQEELHATLSKLPKTPRLSFSLGGHRKLDIDWAEIIIVNPGVPREHPLLLYAQKKKKILLNDTAIFFARSSKTIIGVTGTRGKTTVTSWIAALLSKKGKTIRPTGNTPQNPLLDELHHATRDMPVVAELSSWQLEFLPESHRAPEIAVMTNLYPDHLNRYSSMEAYADAKANIFLDQKATDTLIVRDDDEWTPYFLSKHPASRIHRVRMGSIPQGMDGTFYKKGTIWEIRGGGKQNIVSGRKFEKRFGKHNLINLLQVIAAIRTYDPKKIIREKDILALSPPRFRQEIVAQSKNLTIVNDTTATSPDGVIAAIERFRTQGTLILITGGTNKELIFSELARTIAKYIRPRYCIFLEGSATTLLTKELGRLNSGRVKWMTPLASLEACMTRALELSRKTRKRSTILFSPGAASFEKFKNEFDRGEQFNVLMQKLIVKKVKKKET